MPVKTTDIGSNISALLGPEGGSWGFLFSSCIPQQAQGNETTLKKSALSQQQLGQVRHARGAGLDIGLAGPSVHLTRIPSHPGTVFPPCLTALELHQQGCQQLPR